MFLGIEIGGTKLQLGIGAGDGVLRALHRERVDAAAGADGIRTQIVQAIPGLLSQANLQRDQLRGVGIGFGGPVDDVTQTVIKSHQIVGWDGFPLAAWIGEMLHLSAVLGNDADVAGLAEALFGAGKNLSPIFYITIGSGIGGGLILDGKIYRGCGRGAAEIGHMRMGTGKQGSDTILEEEASGWAIARKARQRLAQSSLDRQGSLLWHLAEGKIDRVTAEMVGHAADKGDPLAQEVFDDALTHLATAIARTIALLCPSRIVIGGGVALMGETQLFAPLRRLVAERVFAPFADCYEIVPAQLGEEMVVHGALALARVR